MSSQLSTGQVWQELEQNIFAVIGIVTRRHEARTAGVVYVVDRRRLYITTGRQAWKTKHIRQNPHISVTVPIAKQIPFFPWFKIPAATITFCAQAREISLSEAPPGLLRRLYRSADPDPDLLADSCIIEITPEKDFVTYGVGVGLLAMRDPHRARGRVSVNGHEKAGESRTPAG